MYRMVVASVLRMQITRELKLGTLCNSLNSCTRQQEGNEFSLFPMEKIKASQHKVIRAGAGKQTLTLQLKQSSKHRCLRK